ncbi:hypothetical protein RUND412_003528 [Rhizina undulata]
MFGFNKTLDVLTLFHSPALPASKRILELLHKASTKAEASTIDPKKPPKALFELDVVEAPGVPTPTQFKSILEFVGKEEVGNILRGAKDEKDAVKILEEGGKEAGERLLRPLLVDWNNGRAVLGADEKKVKELVDTLPQ